MSMDNCYPELIKCKCIDQLHVSGYLGIMWSQFGIKVTFRPRFRQQLQTLFGHKPCVFHNTNSLCCQLAF